MEMQQLQGKLNLNQTQLDSLVEMCESKAAEFKMIGYEHITAEDVWACLAELYEKKGYPRLHRIVNDILSMKVTQLMNWMTIGAFKGDMRF